jgi:hypothetical protein
MKHAVVLARKPQSNPFGGMDGEAMQPRFDAGLNKSSRPRRQEMTEAPERALGGFRGSQTVRDYD